MDVEIVEGDLLAQDVDVIVNPWNRNIIPWWLLIPQGVSGAIKRQGGYEPFRQVRRYGAIKPGGAVITGTGKLPFKGIIHVAGINMLWRSSEKTIRKCILSAIDIAVENGFNSIAIPAIGAGTGGYDRDKSIAIITDELKKIESSIRVVVVRYKKN